MTDKTKSRLKSAARWIIAIIGIWIVCANITWYDSVLIQGADGRPLKCTLLDDHDDSAEQFRIRDGATGAERVVNRDELFTRAESRKVRLMSDPTHDAAVLALRPSADFERTRQPVAILVVPSGASDPRWVKPSEVVGGYTQAIPYPRVEAGLKRLLHQADPRLLWLAIAVFPVTFILTSVRWYKLLQALDINMTMARTFALNMVGSFYNTFMPGSTGGDVVKAYYAAKNSPLLRTRAVMSVVIDRAIGLIALVILGGITASMQLQIAECRRVAFGAAFILVSAAAGLVLFYGRKQLGLERLILRLPMQTQLQKAIETLEIYRKRAGLVLIALLSTFPVHATVVLSAMFAGMAFGLPLSWQYYWVVVPVVVLSGSIPISPQGAGVMEFFAFALTRSHGCTVVQALALTMSIRLVQILWNLSGGYFVLRGGYHAPHEPTATVPAV